MFNRKLLIRRIGVILLGLFFSILLLEILMRFFGGIYLSLQEDQNRKAIRKKGVYRIMCIGESTTAGGGDSYPNQLEEILNHENIRVIFSVINRGIDGTNTSIIVSELEKNIEKYKPDMVIAMMGINDITPYGNIFVPDKISLKIYKLLKYLWYNVTVENQRLVYKFDQKTDSLNIEHSLEKIRNKYMLGSNIKICEGEFEWIYRFINDRPDICFEIFKKVIDAEADNYLAHLALGIWHKKKGDYKKSIEMHKKAIVLNPKKIEAYYELGGLYRDFSMCEESENFFKKAVETGIQNDRLYLELGKLYQFKGKQSEAEIAFEKAIRINRYNYKGYYELSGLYIEQERYDEAEKLIKKAINFDLKNDKFYRRLVFLSAKQGKNSFSCIYSEKEKLAESCSYSSVTYSNYQKCKNILDQKGGIKLVCVQYPMRSIEPLKKMLERYEDVIFVDNEEIFKEAVVRENYEKYFVDIFGGDFGHCTKEGNKLLARNIANVILKEYFLEKK